MAQGWRSSISWAEFARRQVAYVASRQRDDGGFPGRDGGSDIYYTDFALRILDLLDPDHPALARRVVETLEKGDFPDLLQLLSLADDPQKSVLGHERAAQLWNDLLHNEKHVPALLIDQISAGPTDAAGATGARYAPA